MTASLNRAAFFAAVRAKPFNGSLTQDQVSGMEAILDACPVDLGTDSLAYCLATAYHETARTMLPVKEYGGAGYFRRMYDIQGERPHVAKALGNTVPGDGVKFAGRGYVQLTGRSNYRRATGELRARGHLTPTQDLIETPDLAMAPDIAAAILFCGMSEGWFTSKKLSHYFGPGRVADPVNARRIINGLDKAETIAGYWRAFRGALIAGGHAPGAVVPSAPVPPVTASPLPPPVFAPAPRNSGTVVSERIDAIDPSPSSPKPSAWARLWDAVRGRG